MTLDDETVDRLGRRLYEAYRDGESVAPFRAETRMSVADGYAVQRAVLDRRETDEGPTVGYKVGFTSRAIREELGVEEPAYGHVLAETVRPEGALDVSSLVDPRVEAELAFRLGRSLDASATAVDVLAATEAVVPVVEVVDCRIDGWDVSGPEAVADDALAARVVYGSRVADPSNLDLRLEGVEMRRNGVSQATGVGADVLGNPAAVVAWLAETLADHGDHLAAGDLVSTGSMTALVPLEPGDVVEARFASLGSVTVRAEAE
ncbi:MAG: 2-keto-4-pentenoate hydratase [Haloplanus sp.]